MISYLQVENLAKSFGDLVLFRNLKFGVGEGQRVAIVAKNGAGKTTLLNIIAGRDTADEGEVTFRRDLRIGFLEQLDSFSSELTVLQAVFASDNPAARVVSEYENAVFHGRDITQLSEQMDAHHAWDFEQRAKQILTRLRITSFDQRVGELSGGQRKSVSLANVLMREPYFLILDEPTNDLDLMTMAVLEEYLKDFDGCVLVVSHDRYFMDKIVDHLFVFEEAGKIKDFPGTYTDYREYRVQQERQQRAEQPRDEKPPAERKKNDGDTARRKLTFAEKREYESLPAEIEALEKEKAALEVSLSSGTLPPGELTEKAQRIGKIIDLLGAKELRWLELDEAAQ